MKSTAPETTLN